MSRALIVTTDGNPLKFNYWCKNYDKYIRGFEVDNIYVTVFSHLSYEMRQTYIELCRERNFKLIYIETVNQGPLAYQLDLAVKEVKEDYLCLLEDDIWILKKGVLNSKFKLLESNQYKLIASPRFSPNAFKDLPPVETIWERQLEDPDKDVLSPYWLWSSWMFLKTSVLKDCIEKFMKEASEFNFMDGGTELHPNSSILNSNYKKYHCFIPAWKFYYGSYKKGVKLPTIHKDWVFQKDFADEVFLIGSIILLKEIGGIQNGLYENQIQLMNNNESLFSVKKWECDWVHATGSSGICGMFGFVRNENNVPIYPSFSYHATGPDIKHECYDYTLFRFVMNYAFVLAYDRDNLIEFKNDYKKYLDIHVGVKHDINVVNDMVETLMLNTI